MLLCGIHGSNETAGAGDFCGSAGEYDGKSGGKNEGEGDNEGVCVHAHECEQLLVNMSGQRAWYI